MTAEQLPEFEATVGFALGVVLDEQEVLKEEVDMLEEDVLDEAVLLEEEVLDLADV